MMYCQWSDVQAYARFLSSDVRRNNVDESQYNYYIEQATDEVQLILKPNYKLADIELDLPKPVVRLTAIICARTLLATKGDITRENTKLMNWFQDEINSLIKVIMSQTLYNSLGEPVQRNMQFAPSAKPMQTPNPLKGVYPDGRNRTY